MIINQAGGNIVNDTLALNLLCLPRPNSIEDSLNFTLDIPANSLFNHILEFRNTDIGMRMLRRNEDGIGENVTYPENTYFPIVELPDGNFAFSRKTNLLNDAFECENSI